VIHRDRERLALRYLEDGLTISTNGAEAWVRVATAPYDLLSDRQRIDIATDQLRALAALRDAECHLLVVPRTYTAAAWAAVLDARTPAPQPGWGPYRAGLEDHVRRQQLAEREVYLGIRIGTSRSRRGAKAALAGAERALGLRPGGPDARALVALRNKAAATVRLLHAAGLACQPATASELRCLVARAMWRGLATPATPERAAADGEILALADGTIRRAGPRSLVIEQSTGDMWVASFGFARFPDELPLPGGEWLYLYDRLAYPLDASVRFQVVPPRQAAADAAAKFAAATDQLRHIEEAGADVPLALLEAAGKAKTLEHAITKDQAPLVYTWPRLTVWAPDQATLEARVVEITERYADLGIEIVRPAGDQLALFCEALPGDRVRVASYHHRQALLTLAGSGYAATSSLGDRCGPYIGVTTGESRTPVHFDPLLSAATNQPTAIAYSGKPGQGKTTTAFLHILQHRLRGGWAVLVDPKGDADGLAALPGLGTVRVVRLDETYAGALDPFGLEPDRDEAQLLAAEMCRQFLPATLAGAVEAHLIQAAADEALTPTPTMNGIVDRLAAHPDPAAAQAGATLAALANYPLARLAFSRGVERPVDLDVHDALTIIQLTDVPFPDPGQPRDTYGVRDRLAVGLMLALTGLATRLMQGPANQPKGIWFDEAWVITGSPQGRHLVQTIARKGRSRNTVLGLISQNVADFLDQTVTNNISAKFCFAANDDTEVHDILTFTGLPPTRANEQTIRGLRVGECIHVDLNHRAGRLGIDLVFAELHHAFNTNPATRAAAHEPAA
jgi:hypothetical protein